MEGRVDDDAVEMVDGEAAAGGEWVGAEAGRPDHDVAVQSGVVGEVEAVLVDPGDGVVLGDVDAECGEGGADVVAASGREAGAERVVGDEADGEAGECFGDLGGGFDAGEAAADDGDGGVVG